MVCPIYQEDGQLSIDLLEDDISCCNNSQHRSTALCIFQYISVKTTHPMLHAFR